MSFINRNSGTNGLEVICWGWHDCGVKLGDWESLLGLVKATSGLWGKPAPDTAWGGTAHSSGQKVSPPLSVTCDVLPKGNEKGNPWLSKHIFIFHCKNELSITSSICLALIVQPWVVAPLKQHRSDVSCYENRNSHFLHVWAHEALRPKSFMCSILLLSLRDEGVVCVKI